MRNIHSTVVIAGFAALLVAAGVASAQTARSDDSRNAPPAGWLSVNEIAAKMEGRGYRVLEVEIDDGAYEVKAVDTNGMRVEADLDPSTGEPFRGWKQDD
ncbi:MAG: PepSY domain-containing protein [Rhizobiaceae bacterium]